MMTERCEEEEKENKKEKENRKFTDEGVPIAYPDDYVRTSTTIVTPDGITMHRTSRGAFKCGQCKYCVQPSLKQKCIYNNATKKERDTSGRAKSGLWRRHIRCHRRRMRTRKRPLPARRFSTAISKRIICMHRGSSRRKGGRRRKTAGEGFSRQRPMGAQSKYIGIIKTSTAKWSS